MKIERMTKYISEFPYKPVKIYQYILLQKNAFFLQDAIEGAGREGTDCIKALLFVYNVAKGRRHFVTSQLRSDWSENRVLLVFV